MGHKLQPRKDVMDFIHSINRGEEIRSVFMNGFCYHFALILKDMFDGEIMWHKGYGHIVCKIGDECYDIEGICDDYNEEDYVPVAALKESIESFKHRGHDRDIDDNMEYHARVADMDLESLYEWIYNKIPEKERVMTSPNLGDSEIWWTTLRSDFCKEHSIKEMPVIVSRQKFDNYVKIQMSGVTNMLDYRYVCANATLTVEEYDDIIDHYSVYAKLYGIHTNG